LIKRFQVRVCPQQNEGFFLWGMVIRWTSTYIPALARFSLIKRGELSEKKPV
jgi:hypothetical protein